MTNNKITINGQEYDSPETMPPDVRRMYDEAMRTLGQSLASGPSGGSTRVFTGHVGDRLGASVVVNRAITVNNRTYGSLDGLPPEARHLYEDAVKGAAPQGANPKFSMHVSVKVGEPKVRTLDDPSRPRMSLPGPIHTTETESNLRDLPMSLAILIAIGLVLWALLGR